MRCGRLLVLCVLGPLGGCLHSNSADTAGDPKNAISYGYQPLDPVPITQVADPANARITRQHLLDALPDETMRMAIGQVDLAGNITYGPVAASASYGRYVVVIDYIKSTTKPIFIKRQADSSTGKITAATVQSAAESNLALPVYLGVGLRLTANLESREANLDLGNLIAIGAAAQAKQVIGTLVVQTLGISGENISTAIPIPTEISSASIQHAILAIGTMKAKLYDVKTSVQPRVVAVYNNIGGGREVINGIISSVLQNPLQLQVPVTQ